MTCIKLQGSKYQWRRTEVFWLSVPKLHPKPHRTEVNGEGNEKWLRNRETTEGKVCYYCWACTCEKKRVIIFGKASMGEGTHNEVNGRLGPSGQRSVWYHCGNRTNIMDIQNNTSNISPKYLPTWWQLYEEPGSREERRSLGGNWKSVWEERKLLESHSVSIYPRKALVLTQV